MMLIDRAEIEDPLDWQTTSESISLLDCQLE
jgi:hypothetical protein